MLAVVHVFTLVLNGWYLPLRDKWTQPLLCLLRTKVSLMPGINIEHF